jgi:hypothetical protein
MHTNNRQPKSMCVLSENNIPFQRFFFPQANLLSSYWWGWLQFHKHLSFFKYFLGQNSFAHNRLFDQINNGRKLIFCIKIQTFFNGFHHYSSYIDYFSINCVPQLAKKGGGGVWCTHRQMQTNDAERSTLV